MSQIIEHPSHFISSGLKEQIRKYSTEAEKLGELHPKQLQTIYERNWFNLFVPKEYGGLELDLIQGLQLEEALAWIDGSFGWTVTLCAGANWFIAFLQPEVAKKIFVNSKVCLAGSGRPSGIAKVNENGYEITGLWKYATGAPHATVFTANCFIEENGSLLKNEMGDSIIRSFWFKSDEITIHKDWNGMGMIATGSHSFEVKDLNVKRDRVFIIDNKYSFHPNPIYQFPFSQFAETTLAVNSSGMAVYFIDLCERIFEEKTIDKSKNEKNITLEIAKEQLNQARKSFYLIVEKSWNGLLKEGIIMNELLIEISKASKTLANIARQVVDELYPYCGMIAAIANSDINSVWRNIHTASQHSLLRAND